MVVNGELLLLQIKQANKIDSAQQERGATLSKQFIYPVAILGGELHEVHTEITFSIAVAKQAY